MNKTKKKEQERKSVKKSKGKDFFQADWNDEVYIQRTIAKKGSIGGSKLG